MAKLALTAPGQLSTYLTTPDVGVQLGVDAGSQYLVAVVNTDATYTSREDFSLRGSFSASTPSAATPATAAAAGDRLPTTPRFDLANHSVAVASQGGTRDREERHLELLEDNRKVFETLGSPRAAWSRAANADTAGGRAAPASALVTPSVGTITKVYVRNSLTATCTDVDSIEARVVTVGQHVIVLADTNRATWPDAYRPDSSFYQSFADEYDQVTWPHILANVGNPLAFDASLSRLGKVTVTITPVLNKFGGSTGGGSVVAFVNSCDYYPYAATGRDADLSNETEMFYSWVPSSDADDVTDWEAALRATAAHETKHIVSYAERIMNDSPTFEDIWLEEGLAQESSEIWERNFNQATWKGHATFAQTVACELDLGANAPCDIAGDKPQALVVGHLPFFFSYLENESTSHSEGLGNDTPANYGAGWTIARWATDQYAANGEGAFIKSLVDEPRLTGMANLSAHTSQPIPLLLVYWNLATAIFQTPTYTIADVRATIPSFDFADIFKVAQTGVRCGQVRCGLFTQSGVPVFPVQPTALASGAFSEVESGIPGTSAVFFLLSANSTGTESLQLLTASGVVLAPTSGFRLAVMRVK